MYIIVKQDGHQRIVASEYPAVHTDDMRAKLEAQRLAKLHPGTKFIVMEASCAYQGQVLVTSVGV